MGGDAAYCWDRIVVGRMRRITVISALFVSMYDISDLISLPTNRICE